MNDLQKIIDEMRNSLETFESDVQSWADRLEAIAEQLTRNKPVLVVDDPCPGCIHGTICRHPDCGRNKTEEMRRRFGGVK
jgi:hypothetical protein